MAGVLTTASNVTCGHGPGRVSATGEQRFTVSGAQVLLKAGIEGKSVSGCTTVTNSNSADLMCPSVSSVTQGEATKLFVGSSAVVLDTLRGATNCTVGGTPQDKLAATANQSKLTAS